MSKEKFTEEQIELLRNNPYTKSVSPNQIRFTDDFKGEFWKEYLEGTHPKDIFKKLGYQPEMIGDRRITNVQYLIVKSHESSATQTTADQKVDKLESEVRALRAELDAVKKIMLMGNSKR